MNPIYRKFEEADIAVLVELMAQLGYQHTEESLMRNVGAVRASGGEVFVAEISGQVCGCISAIIDVRLAAGVNGELVSLVVNDEKRGRGIGKGLVAIAERWLKERTPRIRIRANSVREGAHLFYQRLGYTLSKTQAVFEKAI